MLGACNHGFWRVYCSLAHGISFHALCEEGCCRSSIMRPYFLKYFVALKRTAGAGGVLECHISLGNNLLTNDTAVRSRKYEWSERSRVGWKIVVAEWEIRWTALIERHTDRFLRRVASIVFHLRLFFWILWFFFWNRRCVVSCFYSKWLQCGFEHSLKLPPEGSSPEISHKYLLGFYNT